MEDENGYSGDDNDSSDDDRITYLNCPETASVAKMKI